MPTGRRDHAIDLGHRAGRRDAGATAEALTVTVEQGPVHAADRGGTRDHLRGDVFTSTDNLVVLPAWARVDGAVFYDVSPRLRVQANVENLLDANYYPYAHSNTNITPGSPRALRVSLTTRF